MGRNRTPTRTALGLPPGVMCGANALLSAIDHFAFDRMCDRLHPFGSRSSTCVGCGVLGFHGFLALLLHSKLCGLG